MGRVVGLLGITVLLAAALVTPMSAGDEPLASIDKFLVTLPTDFETIPGMAVKLMLEAGKGLFLLDLREPEEFSAERIEGAANVPIRTLARATRMLPADKDTTIVVICRTGIRAAYATMTLKILGYTNVKDMAGGMVAWRNQQLPVAR